MVTELPSSSEPAPGEAQWGCDTSDLIQVHKILRWLFTELPGLIERVPSGDLERSATIADHVSMVAFAVHLHHESEDSVLWDRIERERRHAPLTSTDAASRRDRGPARDHRAAGPGWRASADPADAAVIVERFGRLREPSSGISARRRPRSSRSPAACSRRPSGVSCEEHARANLPKDMIPLQLGLMLASIPPEERDQWSKENLPAPIRLLYSLVLKRKYERHMLTLYPDGAVPSMT